MFLDMLGILLNDFLNQTICCRVLFGDPSRMSRGKDLLEGGEGGREGQNGGDGKRKPTNCHSLGRESDKGRDGWEARNPRSQKFIRNPIVSYPESHGIYPNVIRNACGSQI